MMNFVFDFGGVVFRWRPSALIARALPHRMTEHADAKRWAQAIFGAYDGEWADFDRGLIAVDELVQSVSRRTGLATQEVQAIVDTVIDELQPVPATVALVQALKDAGHRLFYLSNMPAPYAEHLERTYPVLSCFDDGVFSARVKLGKPDPAIFALALQRFGIHAHECVFLDDHPANIDAARAAGWHAVHFIDAMSAADELCRQGWCRGLTISDQ